MDEVLQPSGLHNYTWPDEDPESYDQVTQKKDLLFAAKLKEASTSVVFDFNAFEKNTRDFDLAEKIFFILSSKKFQFTPTTLLKKETIWLERIRFFISQKKPVQIVYPLMCKIGNWAKQMTNIGPNAGEISTLHFFNLLNTLVRKVYPQGLEICIICDAQLYNSAFQNTEVEIYRYMRKCESLINKMKLSSFIKFYNYVQLLSEINYYEKYFSLHYQYHKDLSNKTNREEIYKSINFPTLFQSIKASINTRKLNLNYQEHKSVFSSIKNKKHSTIIKEIDFLTEIAFKEVIAIRKTCGDLNIFEELFPNHVRVSCHKGPKNGKHIIGLRPYPEYYGSSKLLPYHGVPLIKKDSKGRKIKLEIHPEIILRSDRRLVRILDEDNCTFFYDATILNI